MAPEREVSPEEISKIEHWICDIKGGRESPASPNFSDAIIIYAVDGEPLVIYYEGLHSDEGRLLCSEKHAQELEEAGIVNFSEVESTKT